MIVAQLAGIDVEAGSKTTIEHGAVKFTGERAVGRYLGRVAGLYGANFTQNTEVDHWVLYADSLAGADAATLAGAADHLNKTFLLRTFLVGQTWTFADAALFVALAGNGAWAGVLAATADSINLGRWFGMCSVNKAFSVAQTALAVSSVGNGGAAKVTKGKSDGAAKGKKKGEEQGKFFTLKGAKDGEVVTRFPPEASGYLHIGHAKAAIINEFLARQYNGKLIMRFDDTNPAKESAVFEKVILEDLKLLGVKPDIFTHTSDHFDFMQTIAEKLIAEGKAYIDETPAEEMARQRMAKETPPNRTKPVEQNQKEWKEMVQGTPFGKSACLRIKMQPNSDNGALRDPVIYRCKPEPHIRTGTKYKVYPTYDFACPIVDSHEGVTHAMRTSEYLARNPQYIMIAEACGMRCPELEDFSRLALVKTCMSKRQLTWFVDEGRVAGWDDPRFPTVRGILKHGLTIEGLRKFIIGMGSSKSNAMMEWDKIWAFNRDVIDPVAPRHTALFKKGLVTIKLEGQTVKTDVRALHPKNPEIGTTSLILAPSVLVEAADADQIVEGTKFTLMGMGNCMCTKVEKLCGVTTSVEATYLADDKDFKGTKKFTFIADCAEEKKYDVQCITYGDLITVNNVTKEEGMEGLKKHASVITEWKYDMIGTSSLESVKQGDIVQIQRKGFFICHQGPNVEQREALNWPYIFVQIPDGKVKQVLLDDALGVPLDAAFAEEAAALCARLKEEHVALKKAKDKDSAKIAEAKLKAAEAVADLLEARNHRATGGASVPAAAAKAPAATKAPAAAATKVAAPAASGDAFSAKAGEIYAKQIEAGAAVAALKKAKAAKDEITAAVQVLLALKKEYKAETGLDVPKPGAPVPTFAGGAAAAVAPAAPAAADAPAASGPGAAILEKHNAQAALVVELKDKKAPKEEVSAAVTVLLGLKKEYKAATGEEVPKPKKSIEKKDTRAKQAKMTDADKAKAAAKREADKKANKDKTKAAKGKTLLGIQNSRDEDLPKWYSEVITKGEMIEYYDVSGCYILRPQAFRIWEFIHGFFDGEIKKLGVENGYFPMFISKAALEKEKDHIEDFAPEVAWITRAGSSEMAEPIAVRPTSETVMYPAYAKWIRSHRELPLKINQWNNVVRWEFKQPQPFLRTREFLWQEGHTAFATKEEADVEVLQILDLYRRIYEELLCVPVVPGRKTEKEKFAGGDYTTTVEAFIPAAGRCIQGATSHHLGQNFSKMFNIEFEDEAGKKQLVYQNSWGLTTRTIGVMVMVHSDDKGLVLPPRVAKTQVVIVPAGIGKGTASAEVVASLKTKCSEHYETLKAAGIRVHLDLRDNVSTGFKFSDWELKGVCVRLELGPRDMEAKVLAACRRDTGEKGIAIKEESLAADVTALLATIQTEMLARAQKDADEGIAVIKDWADVMPTLAAKKVMQIPFCGGKDCEGQIKDMTVKQSLPDGEEEDTAAGPSMGMKSLCFPFKPRFTLDPGMKCLNPECKEAAVGVCMFGRSY
jgi:bifunctional glutamyl/prolyl-tRNA synthetase